MTTENELSSQMRNAMMVFVAKFLFVILPPLIAVFFYILTMTKNDVKITVDKKIAEIEQTYESKIAEMKTLHYNIRQFQKAKRKPFGGFIRTGKEHMKHLYGFMINMLPS